MDKWLAVGLGGFVGAVARYGASGLVHRFVNSSFPAGTLFVNTLGCLVMGGLMCLFEERQFFGSGTRLFVMFGILGSFTTFSTFGYETLAILRDGEFPLALGNVAANVLLGLAAVWLGWTAVRLLGV